MDVNYATNTLVPKSYVDASISAIPSPDLSAYVPKSGATMTGPLLLAGNPSNNSEATTRAYVDA